MFFKDWRKCSQHLINIELSKDRFYYIQAQAWHLKGYLGGTHSYSVFYCDLHKKFLVVELSDLETVQYQNCSIIYQGVESTDKSKHCVLITDRAFNAQWFGNDPYLIDSCDKINYSGVIDIAQSYPINKFNLLLSNCNTFTSYVHYRMQVDMLVPLRSIGYKSKKWWNKNYGT